MSHTLTYAFVADATLQAKQSVHSHVTGRVQPGGLAYRLTVAKRTTQVVRTRKATYVRKVPGRWARLKHPHAIVNPTTTLLAVLHGLTPTGLVDKQTIAGRLSPAAAKAAQLPAAAASTVLVHLDAAGHVTSLLIRAHAKAGLQSVDLVVRTTYSSFGHVAAIRRPV